jgi:hypothetical protein
MSETTPYISAHELCAERRAPDARTHEIETEYPDYEGVYAISVCVYCGLIAEKWTHEEYIESIEQDKENNPTIPGSMKS